MAVTATHNTRQQQSVFPEIGRYRKPALEGYMTLEEFHVEAKASLTKTLNEGGIILGVPQTIEQLKQSVKKSEVQYKLGLGKSNEEIFNKYAQWI